MADEISTNITLQLKGTVGGSLQTLFTVAPGSKTFDQAAVGYDEGIVSVSTSDTAYTFDNITTEGWLLLHNLDSSNYVEVGPDSGGAIIKFLRIEPDEVHVMRLFPGLTFRWQANTAACKVRYVLLED